jgi:hypothetical protein
MVMPRDEVACPFWIIYSFFIIVVVLALPARRFPTSKIQNSTTGAAQTSSAQTSNLRDMDPILMGLDCPTNRIPSCVLRFGELIASRAVCAVRCAVPF